MFVYMRVCVFVYARCECVCVCVCVCVCTVQTCPGQRHTGSFCWQCENGWLLLCGCLSVLLCEAGSIVPDHCPLLTQDLLFACSHAPTLWLGPSANETGSSEQRTGCVPSFSLSLSLSRSLSLSLSLCPGAIVCCRISF